MLSSSGWSKLEVARELKHPIHGFPKEGNSMSWRWPVQWLVAGGGWLGRGSTNEFLTAQNIWDQALAWPGVGDCSLPWAPRVHTHYRDNSAEHKNGGKYAKK